MPATKQPSFAGFDPGLLEFLRDLGKNNDKKWFETHRSEYESLYLEPARRFVEAIAPGLAKISPELRAEPRVNGAIMRINRDTRFSKDKTPYKTGLFIRFGEGQGKGTSGFGVRIHATGSGMMGGAFGFEDAALERYRQAVDDAKRGPALVKAVAAVAKKGYAISEPHYKRVPKGFDPDHPRADWLRHRSLYVYRNDSPAPRALFGPEAVAFCLERFKAMRPVQKWLADIL
jgi:uncharacterized protein (TIGR02453 family)